MNNITPFESLPPSDLSFPAYKLAAVPARVALSRAMESNTANGHENLGFLSDIHGFMPAHQSLLKMPPSHRAWDDLAHDLPALYRRQTLRRKLEEMPVLAVDHISLDDIFHARASVILSVFAHAYVSGKELAAKNCRQRIGKELGSKNWGHSKELGSDSTLRSCGGAIRVAYRKESIMRWILLPSAPVLEM